MSSSSRGFLPLPPDVSDVGTPGARSGGQEETEIEDDVHPIFSEDFLKKNPSLADAGLVLREGGV
jgi:hypothetical protein